MREWNSYDLATALYRRRRLRVLFRIGANSDGQDFHQLESMGEEMGELRTFRTERKRCCEYAKRECGPTGFREPQGGWYGYGLIEEEIC